MALINFRSSRTFEQAGKVKIWQQWSDIGDKVGSDGIEKIFEILGKAPQHFAKGMPSFKLSAAKQSECEDSN